MCCVVLEHFIASKVCKNDHYSYTFISIFCKIHSRLPFPLIHIYFFRPSSRIILLWLTISILTTTFNVILCRVCLGVYTVGFYRIALGCHIQSLSFSFPFSSSQTYRNKFAISFACWSNHRIVFLSIFSFNYIFFYAAVSKSVSSAAAALKTTKFSIHTGLHTPVFLLIILSTSSVRCKVLGMPIVIGPYL